MTHAVFSPTQLEWIRQHLKVAVIHGGDKSHTSSFIFENLSPRSSKTYAAVAHDIACALMESGFQHVEVLAEDIELAQQLREKQIDLVITNSGGLQGFDAMCHLPRAPFVTVGSDEAFDRRLSMPSLNRRLRKWTSVSGPSSEPK